MQNLALSDSTVCRYAASGGERSETTAEEEYVQYSVEWTVHVNGGILTADALAEEHGFINSGLVSDYRALLGGKLSMRVYVEL